MLVIISFPTRIVLSCWFHVHQVKSLTFVSAQEHCSFSGFAAVSHGHCANHAWGHIHDWSGYRSTPVQDVLSTNPNRTKDHRERWWDCGGQGGLSILLVRMGRCSTVSPRAEAWKVAHSKRRPSGSASTVWSRSVWTLAKGYEQDELLYPRAEKDAAEFHSLQWVKSCLIRVFSCILWCYQHTTRFLSDRFDF